MVFIFLLHFLWDIDVFLILKQRGFGFAVFFL